MELLFYTIYIILILVILLLPILLPIIIVLFLKRNKNTHVKWNENNEYYEITHKEFSEVFGNIGRWGEYLIYERLKSLPGNRRFLFNLYIANGDGKTTEIDVLLIHETGLYVFESKNYSGWIFGSEKNKNWTQCLKGGRTSNKIQFYNPIKQNENHIKRLADLLSGKFTCQIYSFIVFSERCELKKIELSSNLHRVIKRDELRRYVPVNSSEVPLSSDEINGIFELLYPYSQVSDEVRKQHIADVDSICNKKAKREKRKSYCPKCGSEMSLLSEENKNGVLKQHWKCLNFKECGHCMYVMKNADTNND